MNRNLKTSKTLSTMKKIFLAIFALTAAISANAQFNMQLHYDLGSAINSDSEEGRQKVTSTLEYFRADKLGSTFLFVDMDYRGKGENNNGALGAYWELGRDFTVADIKNTNSSITAHVEYDAGLSTSAGSFQQALLAGPALQWHSADFSKTFTLQALYKHYLKHGNNDAHASFQTTAVWGVNFAQGLCTFSGFADLWYGYTPKFEAGKQKKGMVFLAEPQFWLNVVGKDRLNDKFSIGTEWEVSNNFIWPTKGSDKSFFVNPTLAVKYTF